jgi:hypothetical protein
MVAVIGKLLPRKKVMEVSGRGFEMIKESEILIPHP